MRKQNSIFSCKRTVLGVHGTRVCSWHGVSHALGIKAVRRASAQIAVGMRCPILSFVDSGCVRNGKVVTHRHACLK